MSTKTDGLFQVGSKPHTGDYRWEERPARLLQVKHKVKGVRKETTSNSDITEMRASSQGDTGQDDESTLRRQSLRVACCSEGMTVTMEGVGKGGGEAPAHDLTISRLISTLQRLQYIYISLKKL